MAGVVPPVAPLPPVAVTLGGIATEDVPVLLDSTSIVVQATPCIKWDTVPAAPGAAVQASAPHWKMLRAFVARCSIGGDPLSFAMARLVSVLVFVLGAAAWSRILTQLRDSGLFASTHTKMRDLARALRDLTIQNPAVLAVLAADVVAVHGWGF